MCLDSFRMAKPRCLPIFILADTSGSMEGEKIQNLNRALQEMVSSLRGISGIRSSIEMAVITFGEEASILHNLTPIKEIKLIELTAGGRTPMGQALNKLVDMIENKDIIPSNSYMPTIVLISDGIPTDIPQNLIEKVINGNETSEDFLGWQPLRSFLESKRGNKSVRLSIGIGNDANTKMLSAFISNPDIPVMKSRDARAIHKFLDFVTLSVSLRSQSKNPDIFFLPDLDFFPED